jgi:hypothetical protein
MPSRGSCHWHRCPSTAMSECDAGPPAAAGARASTIGVAGEASGVLRWCLAALRAPRAPEGRKRADLRVPARPQAVNTRPPGGRATRGRSARPTGARGALSAARPHRKTAAAPTATRHPERCQARTVALGRNPGACAQGTAAGDWRNPRFSAHGTAGGGAGEARGAGALRRVVATARGSRPAGRVLTGPREPSRAVDPRFAPNRARAPGLARAWHDQLPGPRPSRARSANRPAPRAPPAPGAISEPSRQMKHRG